MTETRITADIIRHLRDLRRRGERVWWLKLHGHAMQRAGVPDLVVVWYDETYWFEVKVPGRAPSRLQQHTMAEIYFAGNEVHVVHSWDEAWKLLTSIPQRKESEK